MQKERFWHHVDDRFVGIVFLPQAKKWETMAKREKTLPPHLKPMLETAEVKFKMPVELHRRLQTVREKSKASGFEFELDEVLTKAAERAIKQVENYLSEADDNLKKSEKPTDSRNEVTTDLRSAAI